MSEQQMSPDLKRLASDRKWFGYLTLENLDAAADRIRQMLGNGQRYTWVAVNEGLGYRPEVRTGQVAESVEAYRLEANGHAHGGVKVVDTYGIWAAHTNVADQAEAAARGGADEALAYLVISHNKIEIEHFAPAGYHLRWVVALEGRS